MRDICGLFDLMFRTLVGTWTPLFVVTLPLLLAVRIRDVLDKIATVGALPLGFRIKLGYIFYGLLLVGLHGLESFPASDSGLSSRGAGIVRPV